MTADVTADTSGNLMLAGRAPSLVLVKALKKSNHTLQNTFASALVQYLEDLDGEQPSGLYEKILLEIEKPLLTTVMDHCKHNQSKAATCLGINRGTLRKKLRQHQIIN